MQLITIEHTGDRVSESKKKNDTYYITTEFVECSCGRTEKGKNILIPDKSHQCITHQPFWRHVATFRERNVGPRTAKPSPRLEIRRSVVKRSKGTLFPPDSSKVGVDKKERLFKEQIE